MDTRKETSSYIKSKAGAAIKTRADKLSRWPEHFSELYNRPGPTLLDPDLESPPLHEPPPNQISNASPSLDEIRIAVASLKNGKAAGPD